MADQIEIKNAGAVERALIPLPRDGGVIVLTGANGTGKSTTLAAVQKSLGGKPDRSELPTARDGAKKGSIEGMGVRLTIARNTRVTGELELLALESRWPVASIVNPGLKDPAAADAARLRALLSLHGAAGDLELFTPLLPKGEMARLVSREAAEATDLVEQSRRIRLDLQERARNAESLAERAATRAATERGSAGDVDLSLAEADEIGLREAVTRLAGERAALRARADAADAAETEVEAAREQLQTIEPPQSIDDLLAEVEQAEEEEKIAGETARVAQEAARNTAEAARLARARLEGSERVAETIAGLERTLGAAAGIVPPSADDLAAADGRLSDAQERAEEAAISRRAAEAIARAETAAEEARGERDRAELMREAAEETDEVLSGALASTRLRVSGGVLTVIDHPRGPAVPYSELSHGERWAIAIQEAAERLHELDPDRAGLLPIPQEAWEGLDPDNRRIVWKAARAARVTVLTAHADAGALRALEWGPTTDEVPS